MEYLETESVPGKYDVYLSQSGERYFVLEGLDVNQIHEPGMVEVFMRTHYDFFEVLYWLLFLVTMTYVVGRFIVTPLYQQYTSKRFTIFGK